MSSNAKIDNVVTIALTVSGATANRSCRSLALAAGFNANPPQGVTQSFDLEVIPKDSLRWVEAVRCQLGRRILGAHCATLKKGSGVFWCPVSVWAQIRPAVDKAVAFFNERKAEFLREYDSRKAALVASYTPMVGAWADRLAPTKDEMARLLGVVVSVDERSSVDAELLRNGLYDLCARLVGETTERKGKLPGENVEARRPQLAAAAKVVDAFAPFLPIETGRCRAVFDRLSLSGLTADGRAALKDAGEWKLLAASEKFDLSRFEAPVPAAPEIPADEPTPETGALDDGMRTDGPAVTIASAAPDEKRTIRLDDGMFKLLLSLLGR